jgi:hypothetical protein
MSLSLSYTVPDAGWRPVYDARLALPKEAGSQAKLQLVSRAMVFQRSGESWDDVEPEAVHGTGQRPHIGTGTEPVAAGPRKPVVLQESPC